ncbi:Rhodanese-like domain-containing protein [Pisolithus marmoratus]|nr:Rhodanese-like domain-containing protein [Pisolithus marmoratus]
MPSSEPSSHPSDASDKRVALRSSANGTVSLRTLDSVRDEVAHGIALRAIMKAKVVEGVKISVYFTFSKRDDDRFLRHVADIIRARLPTRHLFALATTGAPSPSSLTNANTLVITGSDADDVQSAVLLASSKFLGRVVSLTNDGDLMSAAIEDIGASSYDSAALWDVLHKSVRAPLSRLVPPPGSCSTLQLINAARAKLQRVTPQQAWDILHDPTYSTPAFLVDIRSVAERTRSGGIHGSLIIERNMLERRFDPRCEDKLAIADRYDLRIIVYCEDGWASSLAAASLHEIGMWNATDIIGGFQAWKAARLPGQVKPPSTESKTATLEGFSQISGESY